MVCSIDIGPDQSNDELSRKILHVHLSCEGKIQRLTRLICQWIAYSSISSVSAEFYNVSENAVNSLALHIWVVSAGVARKFCGVLFSSSLAGGTPSGCHC